MKTPQQHKADALIGAMKCRRKTELNNIKRKLGKQTTGKRFSVSWFNRIDHQKYILANLKNKK